MNELTPEERATNEGACRNLKAKVEGKELSERDITQAQENITDGGVEADIVWGHGGKLNRLELFRLCKEAGFFDAQLVKLAGITDEKSVEDLAREFYDVWQEAKSSMGDNWDDISFDQLPGKHKEEYLKTARRILSFILPVKVARDRKVREKISDSIHTLLAKSLCPYSERDMQICLDQILALREPPVKLRLIEYEGHPAIEFPDGDIVQDSEPLATFLMHLSIVMPGCNLPNEFYVSA